MRKALAFYYIRRKTGKIRLPSYVKTLILCGFYQNQGNFGAYKQLLIALKKAGIITQGIDDNNIFGSGTTAATKQLQKAAKLTQDGFAGSQTIRAAYVMLAKKI